MGVDAHAAIAISVLGVRIVEPCIASNGHRGRGIFLGGGAGGGALVFMWDGALLFWGWGWPLGYSSIKF